MPCYKPLSAYQVFNPKPGQKKIIFNPRERPVIDLGRYIDLACGQCVGCRLQRSLRWAARITHETKSHDFNSFITLTYDKNHLPKDGSLNVEHFQEFMDKLRAHTRRLWKKAKQSGSSSPLQKIRYFHCGEYGDENGRPHYHAILFGEAFMSDRYRIEDTQTGFKQYMSDTLTKIWGQGRATIGEVSFESAAYVARYSLKKIPNEKIRDHNGQYIDNPDYLAHYNGRKPEYITMSRNPGIGSAWISRHHAETYLHDSVVLRGKELLPPPFYDKYLIKLSYPPLTQSPPTLADWLENYSGYAKLYNSIKKQRVEGAQDFAESEDSRTGRLLVREECKLETIKSALRRSV